MHYFFIQCFDKLEDLQIIDLDLIKVLILRQQMTLASILYPRDYMSCEQYQEMTSIFNKALLSACTRHHAICGSFIITVF